MKFFLSHLLLAFFLFNQSINFDYRINYDVHQSREYDDIDSILELILEKIAGDDHLVSENDDDSGIPENKDDAKENCRFSYYQETNNMVPATFATGERQLLIVPDNNNITGKGHHFIISHPPDFCC